MRDEIELYLSPRGNSEFRMIGTFEGPHSHCVEMNESNSSEFSLIHVQQTRKNHLMNINTINSFNANIFLVC